MTALEAECDHVALMLAERGEGLYDLTGTSMLGVAQMKLRDVGRAQLRLQEGMRSQTAAKGHSPLVDVVGSGRSLEDSTDLADRRRSSVDGVLIVLCPVSLIIFAVDADITSHLLQGLRRSWSARTAVAVVAAVLGLGCLL